MTMKVTFFICFIITFIFSCQSKSITTTCGSVSWWCTQTPYYQTCNRYVAVSKNATATISIKQFLDMTVEAAIDEARVVLKRVQKIEANCPDVLEKKVWHNCPFYFDGTVYKLNKVLDRTNQPSPNDIYAWLNEGITYADGCEEEFEMANITTNMLPKITTNLMQLLFNSLAIGSALKGGNPPVLLE